MNKLKEFNYDELLNSIFNSEYTPPVTYKETCNYTTKTDGDQAVIALDIPGLDRSMIKIYSEDGLLVIDGKGSDRSYLKKFKLGDGLNPQKATAVLKNGVLTVCVPKTKKAKLVEILIG
jgi:HSP20 family molecular chaperone IbpA